MLNKHKITFLTETGGAACFNSAWKYTEIFFLSSCCLLEIWMLKQRRIYIINANCNLLQNGLARKQQICFTTSIIPNSQVVIFKMKNWGSCSGKTVNNDIENCCLRTGNFFVFVKSLLHTAMIGHTNVT